MRTILISLLVMASVCFGNRLEGGRLGVPAYDLLKAADSKYVAYVDAGQNPESVYDALIAKAGTLSETVRAMVILGPGTHLTSGTWELDTEYVDVAGMTGNPDSTIVDRGATGGATVTQTAGDVRLYNFTIQNTHAESDVTDRGFVIAAANTASEYRNMRFWKDRDGTNNAQTHGYPVYATCEWGGTWWNCESLDYAWRTADGFDSVGTMYDCTVRDYGYHGDNELNDSGTGELNMKMYRCYGRDFCYAACDTYGANIGSDAWLEDCIGRHGCYAIRKNIAGTLIRCKGGNYCFGGVNDQQTAAVANTISGALIDCISTGGRSFACHGLGGTISGRVEGCRWGSETDLKNGVAFAGPVTIGTDPGDNSWLSVGMTGGDDASLLLYAKQVGVFGDSYKFWLSSFGRAGDGVWTVEAPNISGYTKLQVNKTSDNEKTAAELKALIEADTYWNTKIGVALAGTGAGQIDDSFTETSLANGDDASIPIIRNNNPYTSTAMPYDGTISAFHNGHTFTNFGATKPTTITLPAAVPGLEFTIVDVVDTAGVDLTLDGNGSEEIGTLGTAAVADDDVNQSITVYCAVAGKWEVKSSSGTWD